MKSLIHAAVMTGAVLAAVVMTTPLYAQIDEPLTFTTDFSFIVNGKTMPAGRYELRPLDDGLGVMRLAQRNGSASVFFDVEPMSGPAPKDSEIVFDETQNTYFLHTIRIADEHVGANVIGVTKSEDRLALNASQKHVPAYRLHPATT